MNLNFRAIDRLRMAANEHGEVADLLATIKDSFPFIADGDTNFHGDAAAKQSLISAAVAAGFVARDRSDDEDA